MLSFARVRDAALAAWIDDHVTFPDMKRFAEESVPPAVSPSAELQQLPDVGADAVVTSWGELEQLLEPLARCSA